MAVKFLDYTGLGYFCSKIKAWCNATFAAITHNHASNAINTMTGYSKPNSSSAIIASDSLNSAIGKLEVKVDNLDDSNIVHKTGNEDISGAKAFSGTIHSFIELARGELPVSDSLWRSFVFSDSTKRSDQNTAAGAVQVMIAPSGNNYAHLRVYKWSAGTTDSAVLTVGYPASGDPYASAPSTSENRSADTDIVTRDWLPKDTRLVHIIGKERITGMKYFNQYFNIEVPLIRGTVPNEAVYSGFSFLDTSEFAANDSSNARKFGAFVNVVGSDGSSHTYIRAYKNVVGNDDSATLEVVYPASGDPYAAAPSTSTNRNVGTDIVTRDFIPNDTRIVHTVGEEIIRGTKFYRASDISFINSPTDNRTHYITPISIESLEVSNSIIPSTIGVSRLAELSFAVDASNDRRVYLAIRKPEANSTEAGTIGIAWDNGATQPRAYCTPTPNIGYAQDILTRDWIPKDNRIVHTTGNETITGAKVFNAYQVRVKSQSIDISTVPSDNLYNQFSISDINDNNLVMLQYCRRKAGESTQCDFKIGVPHPTTGTLSMFQIGWDVNDKEYTYIPTPSLSDNSSSIANTSWVRTATGNFACNAASASKLATARSLKVALDSTTDITFDGSSNQNSIPVSGILAIANGGTGSSTKNFVDLSNSQTVSGTKTFSNNILCNALRSATTNTGSLTLEGGTSGSGSFLALYGKDNSNVDRKGGFIIQCRKTDGTVSSAFIGSPEGNLIWKGQTIQTSSDERLKTAISEVPSDILDAWSDVQWGKFQFHDAVNEKGSNDARYHVGLIAQSVNKVFKSYNKDILKYGVLCYDKSIKIEGEEFAGIWTVRYTEALCMEAAYQRRKNKVLENRISELEKRLAKLEGVI